MSSQSIHLWSIQYLIVDWQVHFIKIQYPLGIGFLPDEKEMHRLRQVLLTLANKQIMVGQWKFLYYSLCYGIVIEGLTFIDTELSMMNYIIQEVLSLSLLDEVSKGFFGGATLETPFNPDQRVKRFRSNSNLSRCRPRRSGKTRLGVSFCHWGTSWMLLVIARPLVTLLKRRT